MTNEVLVNELRKKGFDARECETIKNGVVFRGIQILTGMNIAPIIYTDEIFERAKMKNSSIEDVVAEVTAIYEESKDVQFDIDNLFDASYIEGNILIGLQRVREEKNLVKKPLEDFEGIEQYLYIKGKSDNEKGFPIKVTKELLGKIQLEEENLWDIALKNTVAESKLQSLLEILMEEEIPEELITAYPMYVLSNNSKFRGAAALLNRSLLEKIGKIHNVKKVIVLPSSIHEVWLIPFRDGMQLDFYSEMVRDVNKTEIAPEERLADRAYCLTV